MRLLLPPSETKAPGGDGPPLDLTALRFPELGDQRQELMHALGNLSQRPEEARAVLGISERLDAEREANLVLATAPTLPALLRYTGVLYDALDPATLSRRARTRAGRMVVVASALFGAVGADDRIPAYRLSGQAAVPGIGSLRRYWRPQLADALSNGLTIDLRSAAYVALAPLPGALAVRVVDGAGRSISHHNKAAKGRLVRCVLECPRQPRTVDELAAAAMAGGLSLRQTGPVELLLTG